MKTKILSLLTLFPLVLLACSGVTTPAPTVEPPPAAIATASLITAEGKLAPNRATELYFVQPGIIAQVLVRPGDQVAEGRVIARLEGIETLQAELAAARLEQILAQQELDWLHEDANLAVAQALKSLADAQDILREKERVLNNMQSPAK